jgi:hypothetical protein
MTRTADSEVRGLVRRAVKRVLEPGLAGLFVSAAGLFLGTGFVWGLHKKLLLDGRKPVERRILKVPPPGKTAGQ